MSAAANDTEEWRALALEAERRGVTPSWLREQCKLLRVPIMGTPRTPLVSRVLIDEALNVRARAAAMRSAEDATVARAVDSMPLKRRARG